MIIYICVCVCLCVCCCLPICCFDFGPCSLEVGTCSPAASPIWHLGGKPRRSRVLTWGSAVLRRSLRIAGVPLLGVAVEVTNGYICINMVINHYKPP